jgi:hypothetical protein
MLAAMLPATDAAVQIAVDMSGFPEDHRVFELLCNEPSVRQLRAAFQIQDPFLASFAFGTMVLAGVDQMGTDLGVEDAIEQVRNRFALAVYAHKKGWVISHDDDTPESDRFVMMALLSELERLGPENYQELDVDHVHALATVQRNAAPDFDVDKLLADFLAAESGTDV